MTFVAFTRSSTPQYSSGWCAESRIAGPVGDAVGHAGDAREVLLIVGPRARDQAAASAEHAVQRALERADHRRPIRRPSRVDHHQVAKLVAECGTSRRGPSSSSTISALRGVEPLLEQEAAIEHRPARVGDARRLNAVHRLSAGDAVDVERRMPAPGGRPASRVMRPASFGCSIARIVQHEPHVRRSRWCPGTACCRARSVHASALRTSRRRDARYRCDRRSAAPG